MPVLYENTPSLICREFREIEDGHLTPLQIVNARDDHPLADIDLCECKEENSTQRKASSSRKRNPRKLVILYFRF